MTAPPALETIDVSMVYPGTIALDAVSMAFRPGEVHALIGKNGAGKSSLIKILSGAQSPTTGQVRVEGRGVAFRSPRDAARLGIATVYQELSLVPELTIAENILLGRFPTKWRGLTVDRRRLYDLARHVLQDMHVALDPSQKVRQLGVAAQQVVEIVKAMSTDPRVLMLDEPTSALSNSETENLFRLIRELAGRGVAIIYISHRLQELQAIADCVSVLRDGRLIGTVPMAQATPERIAEMMFGETVRKVTAAPPPASDAIVLEVQNLTAANRFRDVSLRLRRGEILGIAGMLGSGRTELLRAISGADSFDSGVIEVNGKAIGTPTPGRMKRAGVGLVPEDRKEQGLVLALSTRANVALAGLDRLSSAGVIRRGRLDALVERAVQHLQIKVPRLDDPVATLSGGNQQKVVVGKWLNTDPQVILFDEPTRGIDVQAKQQIFQIMADLSARGIGCIFVSSELEELVDVCHRILIMQDGRIVGEVMSGSISAQELFQRCVKPAASWDAA